MEDRINQHIFVDDVNPMEDTFEDNEPTFHGTYFSNDSHIIKSTNLEGKNE